MLTSVSWCLIVASLSRILKECCFIFLFHCSASMTQMLDSDSVSRKRYSNILSWNAGNFVSLAAKTRSMTTRPMKMKDTPHVLPHGWIKEMKLLKCRIKADPVLHHMTSVCIILVGALGMYQSKRLVLIHCVGMTYTLTGICQYGTYWFDIGSIYW